MAAEPSLARRIAERVFGSRFARSVTILAGGTAISYGLAVIAAPIITRLYLPEDMGRFGIFTAFITTLVVLTGARYDIAIVSAETREDAARLTLGSVAVALLLSLFGAAGLLVCIRARFLGFGVLPVWSAGFALVMLIILSLFNSLRYWFIREEAFGLISRIVVYQGIARTGSQVAFGFFSTGWLGLMGGDLLGRCVGLGRMVISSWRPLWQHVGRPVAANVAVAFRKYRQFPIYSLPSTVIDTLVINLPLLLVGYFYGPGAAGQFTLVQRLLTIPIAPISGSVADAFHGRAATYLRDDPAALKGFFLRTSKFLLLSGIVPTLAIMILAPLTFGWIFGAKWATAGVLTAIMAPPMFGHLVISPSTRLFVLVEGGPKTKLIADAVGISAVVGTLFSGHALGWDLRRTLTLFSAVYCCALAFYFFILYRLVLQAERKR